MASEVFTPTSNNGSGALVGGYSSDYPTDTDQIVARFDPTTKRLLVDTVITAFTGVKDGAVVDADNTGSLALGTDGTNYQVVATDADGHIQVDVLSGGSGGTQYTEGDTDASITGTAAMMEGAANTLLPVQGTVADGLLVNLGANNDVVEASAADIKTAVQLIDNAISGTEMQVDVVAALPAGTNTIGNVGVIGLTSGGPSPFRTISLTATKQEIKSSGGQVFGYYIFNAHTATQYVKLYNAAAANVTVGTTTPWMTIPIPAGAAANLLGVAGIAFATGITIAATTGVADNDTGAPSANTVIANIFYL
jgi:hypothetical protein